MTPERLLPVVQYTPRHALDYNTNHLWPEGLVEHRLDYREDHLTHLNQAHHGTD